MPVRDIDVLAIGGIDRDLVLKVPFLPGHDEKADGEFLGWFSGGPVANMACAASRLGLRVHAVCQVGDDEGGQLFLEDYRRFGVNTDLCRVAPGEVTPFTVILIDPTGEKVIIYVSARSVVYDLARIDAALARTKVVFLLPHSPYFAELTRMARTRGAKVMTDIEPGGPDDAARLDALLAQVDIASFNQFGVRAWTGKKPTPMLAHRLLAKGPETILFTLGARGAIGASAQAKVQCSGLAVSTVDSTGAGDTFHGAFLAAWLAGRNLEEALRYANAAGALSVTAIGPRGRLPTHEEVTAFQATQA